VPGRGTLPGILHTLGIKVVPMTLNDDEMLDHAALKQLDQDAAEIRYEDMQPLPSVEESSSAAETPGRSGQGGGGKSVIDGRMLPINTMLDQVTTPYKQLEVVFNHKNLCAPEDGHLAFDSPSRPWAVACHATH